MAVSQPNQSPPPTQQIQRNFLRTGAWAGIAFAATSLLNLLLIGWLARHGGPELVGQWAGINAIATAVLAADLGFATSLTRMISAGRYETADSVLRRLIQLGCIGVAITIATAWFAQQYVPTIWLVASQSVAAAIVAGMLQLISNWLLTPRSGQHQQHWQHLNTLLRVSLQTAITYWLCRQGHLANSIVFAAALLISRVVEIAVSWQLYHSSHLRAHHASSPPAASLAQLRDALRGYWAWSVTSTTQPAIWRGLVWMLTGNAGLGSFVIALRIPTAIVAISSEGLAALLPGLTQLRESKDQQAASGLLQRSLLFQFSCALPLCILYVTVCPVFLTMWLGAAPFPLVETTRWVTVALLVNALVAPFYWALHANRDANAIAVATVINTLVVSFGAVVAWSAPSQAEKLYLFAFAFFIAHLVSSLLLILRAERKWKLVITSVSNLSIWKLLLLSCGCLAYASCCVKWTLRPCCLSIFASQVADLASSQASIASTAGDLSQFAALCLACLLFVVPVGIGLISLHRRNFFLVMQRSQAKG